MAIRDNLTGNSYNATPAFVILSGYSWSTLIGNSSQATGSNNVVTAPAIVTGGSYVKNSATKMTFTFDKPVSKYCGNLGGCLQDGLTLTINGIQIDSSHVIEKVENWQIDHHGQSLFAYAEVTFPETSTVVIERSVESNLVGIYGIFI